MVVTGRSQPRLTCLHQVSGLSEAARVPRERGGRAWRICTLRSADVVRHRWFQRVVQAYARLVRTPMAKSQASRP